MIKRFGGCVCSFLLLVAVNLLVVQLSTTQQVQAVELPPSIAQIDSDVLVNKTGIVAVPYIMNDWENCDPATLKRGTDPQTDCWSHLSNEQALPVERPL